MIQIINLAQKFEKSKLSHIGFFHYIKNYFNKKHPSSYDSKMAIFLNSVVKYGKDGSQLNFFAHLIESNTEFLIISALVKAVDLMKKKYQELNGRSDDSFKKVKMNIQDILKILKRIFQKKIDNYVDLNGTNLQVRVRDYVIEIQPTVIMETSGLGFLEIVRREAVLVRQHLEKELALSANTEDLFRERPEEEHDLQTMQENFYNINDFMGHQYHHLPDGYVKGVKKYQMFQRMGDERVDPKLREGGANYEPENKGAVDDIEELSFDDIYETIHDKQMDRDFLDLIKNVQKMEKKSKDLDSDLQELPVFQAYVDELNQQMLAKLKDRYEKMQFMKAMMMKLTNHFENAGDQMTSGDQDINEDVETEEHFYMHFHKDLAGKLFGVKKIERHIVTEYYKSSNKSKFQRIGGIYDYDKPQKSPGELKKGKQNSDDEDFDYNYEDDEDFQDGFRSKNKKNTQGARNSKTGREESLKRQNPKDDSSEQEESNGEVDDDYLETVKDNIRKNTTSKQKELLRNRRLKNEQNVTGRNSKNQGNRQQQRSDSEEEEESGSNYQENLGRLADYVKSSEYHKRKDLETGNASSDEEGEVVFKNTKQKSGVNGGSKAAAGVEYSKIKRTAQSSDSEEDGNGEDEDEYENSYDRYPHLKDSNSQSLTNSKVSPKKTQGLNTGNSKIKVRDEEEHSDEEDDDEEGQY